MVGPWHRYQSGFEAIEHENRASKFFEDRMITVEGPDFLASFKTSYETLYEKPYNFLPTEKEVFAHSMMTDIPALAVQVQGDGGDSISI